MNTKERIERLEYFVMNLQAQVLVMGDLTLTGKTNVKPEDLHKGLLSVAKDMAELLEDKTK